MSYGVMVSAYMTELTVELSLVDGKLTANISSTAESRPGDEYGYLRQVRLEADVEMSDLGGVGMYYSSSTGSDNSTVLTYWNAEIEKLDDTGEPGEPGDPITITESGSGSGFNRVAGSSINSNANRSVALAGLLGSEFEGISIVTGNKDGRMVVAEGITNATTFTLYMHTNGNSWVSYEVTINSDGEIMLHQGAHVGIKVAE